VTTTSNQTVIEADPALPTVRISREFAAAPDRVYRAWTEPELVAQWLGPKDTPIRIEFWDARTGGSYRYSAWRDGEKIAGFYGSFHELRQNARLVQTFTYEDIADGVSLETVTFEDLGDRRTRVVALAVVDTMEARDMMIFSGMEKGVIEGYEKLDELLREGP
jgi:uncharacterized protein YndB with AHSA1/START domain